MYNDTFKRIFDLFFAIMALPFFIIILIVFGPIIYFQDKGSVFYNAPRLGKDGKIFTMYKLRSMKMNAPDIRNKDGSTYNAKDDPRLTRVGRFLKQTSIDETPQILNIIKGDMSFIGPRPDLPEHCDLYVGNEARKLEVRPGITGFNQAYYRNAVEWKERIQHDIYYIDNLSLWLDIRIFLRTLITVLMRKDVFVTVNKEKRSNISI